MLIAHFCFCQTKKRYFYIMRAKYYGWDEKKVCFLLAQFMEQNIVCNTKSSNIMRKKTQKNNGFRNDESLKEVFLNEL